MSRRPETDRLVCCGLSLREQEAVALMKTMTGLPTDADLLRVALYRFAAHLEVGETALFRLRGTRCAKASARWALRPRQRLLAERKAHA